MNIVPVLSRASAVTRTHSSWSCKLAGFPVHFVLYCTDHLLNKPKFKLTVTAADLATTSGLFRLRSFCCLHTDHVACRVTPCTVEDQNKNNFFVFKFRYKINGEFRNKILNLKLRFLKKNVFLFYPMGKIRFVKAIYILYSTFTLNCLEHFLHDCPTHQNLTWAKTWPADTDTAEGEDRRPPPPPPPPCHVCSVA